MDILILLLSRPAVLVDVQVKMLVEISGFRS